MSKRAWESLICASALLSATACGGATSEGPATAEVMTTDRDCGDGTILFASESAELDEGDRTQLDELGACLSRHEIDTLYVTGSADPRGGSQMNRELAARRAQAVAGYLQSIGVDAQYVVRSRGELGADDNGVLWPADRAAQVSVPASETPAVERLPADQPPNPATNAPGLTVAH